MPKVSVVSEKGRRTNQEDTYVVAEDNKSKRINGWLLCVFDGHNGNVVSKFAAEEAKGIFITSKEKYPNNTRRAMGLFVERMVEYTAHFPLQGSTLSAVYVPNSKRRAVIATMGDSPVLVVGKLGEVFTSTLHNINNPAELSGAKKRGGIYDGARYVTNSMGVGVNVLRCLGDSELPFLGRKPDISSVLLDANSSLIVATDGFLLPGFKFDHFEKFLRGGGEAEDLLVCPCYAKLHDNATAIVWRA